MKTKFLTFVFIVGFILSMTSGSNSVAAVNSTNDTSPLISAESLGYATYNTLVASLQDKIDRSNEADQGWLRKLWEIVCYLLQNILHDPRVVQYVKLEYMTTTASGERIPVTGLAILPQAQGTHPTVPMISFQHPTEVERKDSPSLFNMTNMWDDPTFDVPFGTLYAMAGFAVVLADYPGMGSNTNAHPYCTESLANSVVDMIRAARDHMKTNSAYAQWDSRLYLAGYSEGGYATVMAARDLQNRYPGEFTNVLGVAGLDGPYSLSDTMRGVMLNADTTFNSPYFLPYTLNGYDSVYAAQNPVFCFTNGIKYSVPTETNFAHKLQWMCMAGTNTSEEINALIYKATPYVGPRSILTDAYMIQLSNSASLLCQTLGSNDAYYAWTPQMQMRLYHYPNDDLVPYGNSTNAYNVFKGRSAPHTELTTYGNDWPLNWLIEWLKGKMGSYHVAAAPIAYVKGIVWLHALAYGSGMEFQFPPNDVDGDGVSDYVVYDETSGTWQMLLSNRLRSWRKQNPNSAPITCFMMLFGGPGSMPLLKDFDGDGKADPCVYNPATGYWNILPSLCDYVPVVFPLGGSASTPVPQDYDGDGLADPAVYNSQTGLWTIYLIPGNQTMTVQFGGPDCVPVQGDYDGDGKADLVVYRESSGEWLSALSGNNYAFTSALFGGSGYRAFSGDFDGDGKIDPAVHQELTGNWFVLLSGTGYTQVGFNFGGPGYMPVIGDYDGDNKADIMVYNEGSGFWSGMMSLYGYDIAIGSFGGAGSRPIP